MGSLIYTLKEIPPGQREEAALRLTKSALLDMKELEVLDVSLKEISREEIFLKVRLKYRQDEIEMEVRA